MCDRFQRLHKFLQNTLANPSADAVPVAQLKLERARSAFLDFLDVPAKDQKQRDQLQKGVYLLHPL